MEDEQIIDKQEKITLDKLEYTLSDKLISLSKQFSFFATSIVGFTALAYLIGWLYARSYYTEFNALWLMSELSSIEIISYSWKIVVGMMVGLYYGLIILLENPERSKYIYPTFKYGTFVVIGLSIIFLILSFLKIDFDRVDVILQFAFLVPSIAIIFLLIFPEKENIGKNSFFIAVFISFLLFGVNQSILYRGKTDAKRDLDVKLTTLSKINLEFDGRQTLRVFRLKGEVFYVVDLDTTNNKSHRIEVVHYKEVKYISKEK